MTTKNLTPYNEANAIQVEAMMSKAMCAYANLQSVEDDRDQLTSLYGRELVEKSLSAHESEYEATVRCVEMFVREGIYEIQQIVRENVKEEFEI